MFVYLILVLLALAFSEGKTTCNQYDFPCDDGTCIDRWRWCDSIEDCPDESDENYCYKGIDNPNGCSANFFLCEDGLCIPIVGRCDGYTSCHDGSDERNCDITPNIMEAYANETRPTAPQSLKLDESDASAKIENVKPIKVDYNFTRRKTLAEAWLLATRDDDYGWGDETARAVTALYLSDPHLLKKHEKVLISKQLHLKISVALIRNRTEVLPLSELASYINALHSICYNPRNFYGYDLVDILRLRTNSAQTSRKFVSPLVYLTLCISNSTTYKDLKDIQEVVFGSRGMDKIDIHALVTLAASCISKIAEFSGYSLGMQVAKNFHKLVTRMGLPENIYELALVIQALDEAGIDKDFWNRTEALRLMTDIQQLDGSFGDVLSTYYALPVLSGKSIATLARHCHSDSGIIPLDVSMNGREKNKSIRYSLYYGNPVEVTQTLRIRVGKSSNLLDIMKVAASTNPMYKFKFDISRGKPLIYSVGGVVNDAEQGMYWTLYREYAQTSSEHERYEEYTGDIRSYIPDASDHIIFWKKYLF